jgi:hypothetical protein
LQPGSLSAIVSPPDNFAIAGKIKRPVNGMIQGYNSAHASSRTNRIYSGPEVGFWEVPKDLPELGNIDPSDFTPVLAKHTKNFNLVDTLSVGVDRIQRNFEPLQRQVETWRKTQIADETAKMIFYSAFIDGKLEAPGTGIHNTCGLSPT